MLEAETPRAEFEIHQAVRQAMEDVGVEMISFDVNRKLKEKGSIAVKEEHESFIKPAISFTVDTLDPLTVETRQSSMARYDCADSLDRVN
jgi:hypothetical protein